MSETLCSSRLRIASACIALASLTTALRADAQLPSAWRVEPSVGIIVDDYDIGLDGDRKGILAALSISRALATQLRGVASLGVARVNDVAAFDPSSGYAMRNEWIFATVGPELDLALPRGSLVVGLEAGAAWRRTPSSGRVPIPPEFAGDSTGSWSVTSVLVPSIHLRIPVAARLALTGGARAYIINVPERMRTSPAFTLGLTFRP
jgi:hypothetical protein